MKDLEDRFSVRAWRPMVKNIMKGTFQLRAFGFVVS
jgi:hypothetical protein